MPLSPRRQYTDTMLYDVGVECLNVFASMLPPTRWHGNSKDRSRALERRCYILAYAGRLKNCLRTSRQTEAICRSSCRLRWRANQHLSARHAYRLTNYYIVSAAATWPPPSAPPCRWSCNSRNWLQRLLRRPAVCFESLNYSQPLKLPASSRRAQPGALSVNNRRSKKTPKFVSTFF